MSLSFFFIFVFFALVGFSMMMMVFERNNERRRREIFLDREFSKLEFLHKKERDVYIKDELFFF
jgi:hypothetical protein